MHEIVDNKWIEGNIESLPLYYVFVFGSNEAGRHSAGAALTAYKKFGAQYCHPVGLQGKSYAIPTKDKKLISLPLTRIQLNVQSAILDFIYYDCIRFLVTRIGCGLAGYNDCDIAPMFKETMNMDNIYLPIEWREYLDDSKRTD